MSNEMKVIKNASWIVMCRVIQAILALVVSALSARYLGPSNYGIISYAASLTAYALPITQLGLNCTLVKEFMSRPQEEGKILGTAIMMSVVSGLLNIGGIFAFLLIFNGDEPFTILVVLLYSTSLIFQATELIIYWYQTHYLSKYVSIVSLCAYVIVSVYKITLLTTGKGVQWFALSNVIDYLIISLALWMIYKRKRGQKLSISFSVGKRLLSKSSVYIVSGLMAVIYAQTDRIMLKNMIGDLETGYYSAALNCAGMTSFIYTAIIDSMRPYVLEAKTTGALDYKNRVKTLYSVIFYLSILNSAFCVIFAKPMIFVLYGEDFAPVASILMVLVWNIVFTYYGGAQSVWMLSENKQKYLPLLGAIGAITNVVLNYLMIPWLHASGAAVATLVTSLISNVLLCCLIKSLHGTIAIFVQSLNPKYFVNIFVKLYRKVKMKQHD